MRYVLCQLIPVHVLIIYLFAPSDLSNSKYGKPHINLLQYVSKQTHVFGINNTVLITASQQSEGSDYTGPQNYSSIRTSERFKRHYKKPLYVHYRQGYICNVRNTIYIYFGETHSTINL